MLLGRRKSGFTEEQVLRPSEIPDYVNEENDTTFARPKSACMGHEAPAAPEPQEWIPPQPMPEYRLLREYIRSQCELHQITPRSQLLGEDPGTGRCWSRSPTIRSARTSRPWRARRIRTTTARRSCPTSLRG